MQPDGPQAIFQLDVLLALEHIPLYWLENKEALASISLFNRIEGHDLTDPLELAHHCDKAGKDYATAFKGDEYYVLYSNAFKPQLAIAKSIEDLWTVAELPPWEAELRLIFTKAIEQMKERLEING